VFYDRLVDPRETIVAEDALTIFDDGSGSILSGRTCQVAKVWPDAQAIYLHVEANDQILPIAPTELHLPDDKAS
jgi:hypothetical protein